MFRNVRVAIQGFEGSYHHEVVENYFGINHTILGCNRFSDIPKMVDIGNADFGVIAIENSIGGSILPNYSIIVNSNMQILGEYYLKINHCLLSLEKEEISTIKEVYSHPMAILQCEKFFEKHPNIKLIEHIDTAYSAKKIKDDSKQNTAAIASKKVANMYGLNIIESNIQTMKDNFTRFFILGEKSYNSIEEVNKASLYFELAHKTGSLERVLSHFSDCGLNLTKIQSIPIIDRIWHYSFIVDFIFDDYLKYQRLLNVISKELDSIKILGEYKRANYD